MDIFTADLEKGKGLKRLTDAPGYDAEASYSPDGSKIIFTSFRDGDGEIYIMDSSGRGIRGGSPTPKGPDRIHLLSPRRAANHLPQRSQRQRPAFKFTSNNTEGTAQRTFDPRTTFVNWGPYWHPDGIHIIYATSKHGHSNYELYVMNVDTGLRRTNHLS